MVSVMFVDDNQAGLTILKEAFGRIGDGWQTSFVPGGDVALHVMAERPVDAIVTSTPLSGMSAASFLRLAKMQYPRTARIALTSPGDKGAQLSALPVANQCLSKACGPGTLTRTVRRATELQAKLFSEATQRVVAQVGALPSMPSALAAVDQALSDEECSLSEIADVMSTDVAIVAKILQLVNSAFFGLRTEIRDLRQAVAYLGIEALRDFALAGSVFRAFTPSPLLPADWLAAFNAHSLAVSGTMTQLARTSATKCEANVVGTLHAVGELVVAERAPQLLTEIAAEVAAGADPAEAEARRMGTTYPVIGGHLLSLWGLGYHVVEAVTFQREGSDGGSERELVDMVRVADFVVSSPGELWDEPGARGLVDNVPLVCPASRRLHLDEAYLSKVGLLDEVLLLHQGFLQLR
ncbi:MAG TPA: HDOD domain-containing protein [Acidimicrobiales bacterium]|nr:HDOD domain-containing protein [Acidimicrobiales bacterium]